jgi:hypothetical protein
MNESSRGHVVCKQSASEQRSELIKFCVSRACAQDANQQHSSLHQRSAESSCKNFMYAVLTPPTASRTLRDLLLQSNGEAAAAWHINVTLNV